VVGADVAENISGYAKSEPDPVKAIQGKDDHVHQEGPWGEDQTQDTHQPLKVESIEGCANFRWYDQPVDQETQPGAKKHECSEETTHWILLLNFEILSGTINLSLREIAGLVGNLADAHRHRQDLTF